MNRHQPAYTFIFLLTILAVAHTIRAQVANTGDSTQFAQIAFEKSDFNYGDVPQGEKVEHIFKFKNTGNAPLILNNVLSTCGCTVPEWPTSPIPPNEEGSLKVIFDSTAKIGRQNKVITIRSNSRSGDYPLRISAMVLPIKE